MAPVNKPQTPPAGVTPPVEPTETTPVTPSKDAELERILTADPQKPIAPPAEVKAVKCPKCKTGTVSVYGQCIACFDKLKPVEKRKHLLIARVTGANAHEYPVDAMKTWKLELEIINAGHWKGPLKFTARKRPLGDVISA